MPPYNLNLPWYDERAMEENTLTKRYGLNPFIILGLNQIHVPIEHTSDNKGGKLEGLVNGTGYSTRHTPHTPHLIKKALIYGLAVVAALYITACSTSAAAPNPTAPPNDSHSSSSEQKPTNLDSRLSETPTPTIGSIATNCRSYDERSGEYKYVPNKIPTGEEIRNAAPADIKEWTLTALRVAYAARSDPQYDDRCMRRAEKLLISANSAIVNSNFGFEEYLAHIEALSEWAYNGNPPDRSQDNLERLRKRAKDFADDDQGAIYQSFLVSRTSGSSVWEDLHKNPGLALKKEKR